MKTTIKQRRMPPTARLHTSPLVTFTGGFSVATTEPVKAPVGSWDGKTLEQQRRERATSKAARSPFPLSIILELARKIPSQGDAEKFLTAAELWESTNPFRLNPFRPASRGIEVFSNAYGRFGAMEARQETIWGNDLESVLKNLSKRIPLNENPDFWGTKGNQAALKWREMQAASRAEK